jgi:hypothetical protein
MRDAGLNSRAGAEDSDSTRLRFHIQPCSLYLSIANSS